MALFKFSEQKCKHPFNDVQIAPVQHKWFDEDMHSGGFNRTSLTLKIHSGSISATKPHVIAIRQVFLIGPKFVNRWTIKLDAANFGKQVIHN